MAGKGKGDRRVTYCDVVEGVSLKNNFTTFIYSAFTISL